MNWSSDRPSMGTILPPVPCSKEDMCLVTQQLFFLNSKNTSIQILQGSVQLPQ